jgi:hypothetical protein
MLKMPLVEYVKSFNADKTLDNVLLIGCQHILESTHLMIKSLYGLGLDPKNVFLLGKCYSTCMTVMREMQEDSIQISPLSTFFDSNDSFDNQFSGIVKLFLHEVLSKVEISKFERIILLDDGG